MLVVDRPRFRQDLVAEAIEEGGHKFIDVGDPESGSMFRFYEVEFSLACGMDGERDVAGIVQWAKDELGLMPSVTEVRNVIATLGELNFLDQTAAARAAATERPAAADAAASREHELAAGVVVGQQQKRPAAGVDLELGQAGAKAAASNEPVPKGVDIELGTPGAGAPAAKPPRAPAEDVGLGAPGAHTAAAAAKSDVSLDLADHMGLKPDDVKEAVRQSKQMAAVEVPKELLAQIEEPVPPSKAEPKAAAKPVEAKPAPVAEKPVAQKPEPKPEAKVAAKQPVAEKSAAQKPEKKPAEKPVVIAEKQPAKQPPAPRQGISPALILLLILAIGGAGAYFAWRYIIRGKDTTVEVTPPPVTPGSGSAVTPPTPTPPPQPKANFEVVPGAQRDILSVFAGTIESIDVAERDVESSDVIARLVGAKRLEREVEALDKEIEKRKTALKTAEAARAKLEPAPAEGSAQPPPPPEAKVKAADAAVAKAYKALEDKQNERASKEEDLEKLYVRAPFEGHLVVFAKPNQKIEENTLVAKLTPKAAPTALFKLEKNIILERGLAVPVKVGEKMHTCEVADSTVDGTRVVCRTDNEGLAAGVEATLMVEQ